MQRFTLPDLVNKKNLIAWLAYDGSPPMVPVTIPAAKQYGMGVKSHTRIVPVDSEETLAIWWSAHRRALSIEYARSPFNQHKPQTHTQWIAECLKAVGIKGFGTVAQRVQRAIAFRPDLYKDAKTVKAEEAAEAARIAALRKQMEADRAAAAAGNTAA
jgi:hypothetical protein